MVLIVKRFRRLAGAFFANTPPSGRPSNLKNRAGVSCTLILAAGRKRVQLGILPRQLLCDRVAYFLAPGAAGATSAFGKKS